MNNGALPADAVSQNQHLYGSQGKKHLEDMNAAHLLDKASNAEAYKEILKPQQTACDNHQIAHNQLRRVADTGGFRKA